MTKEVTALNKDSQVPILITPSLLNSWGYIWECAKGVREAQNDTICLEDKILEKQEQAFQDFLRTLKRIPSEPNIYMQRGIEFEEECYKGNTPISNIIENGAYQIVGKKNVEVDGYKILLYGRLDVLKGGTIYDIKRVSKYETQKYINSYQHGFYLTLFENAKDFKYLAFDDSGRLHIETYYKDQVKDTLQIVSDFIKWLKKNNLFDILKDKWGSKYGL